MRQKIAVLSLLVVAAGCSTTQVETSPDDPSRVTRRITTKGSVQDVTSRGVVSRVWFAETVDRSELKSHSNPVCLLDGQLPEGLKYREVGRIKANKKTYGTPDEVLLAMADEARRLGVEAITGLEARQRRGMMPWRMSVPANGGTLVKLDAESLPLDCAKLEGQLF
jgi:hypothetical protein